MNINSVNSLLKVIEEPNEQITFFLVHNIQKNIFSTLKSRCIQLKVFLDEKQKIEVINSLTEDKFFEKLILTLKIIIFHLVNISSFIIIVKITT